MRRSASVKAVLLVVRAFFANRATLAAENMAWRHQLYVVKRSVKRPKIKERDRLFWMFLSKTWTEWRDHLVIVKPDTVIQWNRRRIKDYWRKISKPKGKKPLTINQLSGGEKTLTATSLLFAIYLMKPAPFCIFDEVDAPLDDANLDKFNMIIRKFSKDSQFIIVTHNKRTMVSTDIIYGITMVEQGISKVVPVDLRELEVNF